MEVGGEHLKEKDTMFALIHFKANEKEGTTDFGYATEKEAEEIAKTVHPKALILRADCDNHAQPCTLKPESLVYKVTIGHYGGTIIQLPEENLQKFKGLFPKGTFPKRIEIKDITKEWTEFGVKAFREKFPEAKLVAYVHFANASKGQSFVEKMNLPYTD